jgi:hypothetical protein
MALPGDRESLALREKGHRVGDVEIANSFINSTDDDLGIESCVSKKAQPGRGCGGKHQA